MRPRGPVGVAAHAVHAERVAERPAVLGAREHGLVALRVLGVAAAVLRRPDLVRRVVVAHAVRDAAPEATAQPAREPARRLLLELHEGGLLLHHVLGVQGVHAARGTAHAAAAPGRTASGRHVEHRGQRRPVAAP